MRTRARLRAFILALLIIAAAHAVVATYQYELTPAQLAAWGPGYSKLINGTGTVSGRVAFASDLRAHVRPFGLGSDTGFSGSLAALAAPGAVALLLATPAISHAEEANPNNYSCLGKISAGKAEAGSNEQQVKYAFYCNGPITGYQLQSQVPISSAPEPPTVNAIEPGLKIGPQLKDTFSCGGEIPGYAVNCVGAAKSGWEKIAGQFAIEKKLCAEPRVDVAVVVHVVPAVRERGRVERAEPDGIDAE